MPESFVTTGQKFGPITCRLGLAVHGQPPEAVIDIGSDIHLHLADPEDARDLLKAAAEALAILDPPIPVPAGVPAPGAGGVVLRGLRRVGGSGADA